MDALSSPAASASTMGRGVQGRDSPIFLPFFYLFSKLLLNCF
jgi:hypothetical protein